MGIWLRKCIYRQIDLDKIDLHISSTFTRKVALKSKTSLDAYSNVCTVVEFSIYILCVNANAINMTQSNRGVEIGSHTIESALIEL
jgi:hypothetical protein